ncbi:MAG: aspartyl/asparaginyl beta-hydroxylase domain-containing protein [Balneolaceae bacterium]
MNILKEIALLPTHALNGFFDRYTGGKNRPIYFPTKETRPELLVFEKNFETVKHEHQNVEKLNAIPAYEDLDKFQYDADEPQTKWKVFVLNMMGEFDEVAEKLCPEICNMIRQVPDVFQAMFSVLEPGRSIPAHKGPYKGYLRYHIGVKIPKVNPPKIRIENTYHTWEEGKGVIFDDSWDHEVINNATEERVVLIVDILRPLPRTPLAINRFLTYKLIKPLYAKSMMKKNELFLKKMENKEMIDS